MRINMRLFILMFATMLIPLALAQEQKIDVELNISTYEINDSFVVGDYFYYNITFNNTGTQRINDTFSVSIVNPSGNLIDSIRHYDLLIEPNARISIIANGSKENETAILPFDISGDYRMEISATKPVDFYRWVVVGKDDSRIFLKYLRQNKNFTYFFDVMPRWQYNLRKQSERVNHELLRLITEMNNATQNTNNATQRMETENSKTLKITESMLWISIIALIVSLLALFKRK